MKNDAAQVGVAVGSNGILAMVQHVADYSTSYLGWAQFAVAVATVLFIGLKAYALWKDIKRKECKKCGSPLQSSSQDS